MDQVETVLGTLNTMHEVLRLASRHIEARLDRGCEGQPQNTKKDFGENVTVLTSATAFRVRRKTPLRGLSAIYAGF